MTPLYRHLKSGVIYNLIMTAKMEKDQEAVCVYRSMETFAVWVRPEAEFHDGRFELLPPEEAQKYIDANFPARNLFEVIGEKVSGAAIARKGDVVFFESESILSDHSFKLFNQHISDALEGTGIKGVLLTGIKVARMEKESDR